MIAWTLVTCFNFWFQISDGEVIDKVMARDNNDRYRIETEYCKMKSKCGIPDVQPNCNCDNLCRIFDDCCGNVYNEKKNNSRNETATILEIDVSYKREQFKCESFLTGKGETSALMVSYCPSTWTYENTRQLCEERHTDNNDNNSLLHTPVSSATSSSVIFRNMYCAYCNNVFEFRYWTFEMMILDNNASDALIRFDFEPLNYSNFRNCGDNKINLISTCLNESNLTTNQIRFKNYCRTEPAVIVFDENKTAYRNKFCAMCNGIGEDSLLCEYEKSVKRQSYNAHVYSFRLIVDFNLQSKGTASVANDKTYEDDFKTCANIHYKMYDPISKTCVNLYCPPMSTAENGKCSPKKKLPNSQECKYVNLKEDEYEILNETAIYLYSLDNVVDSANFLINGSNVLVCYGLTQLVTAYRRLTTSDVTENYITLIGLICSIFALAVTLIVYMMFSELRNLPGKILISLMAALLLAQVLFLSSSHAVNHRIPCIVMAMSVHYFFIASFSWMNVIAYDLFITFSQLRRYNTLKSNLFYKYSVYGWLLPAFIVLSAIISEYSSGVESKFKPRYGDAVCWISSKSALLLFFLGPLAIFKLFDVVAFVCTSYHISMSRRQSTIARRYTICSFLLYLKLSLIMGLTWIFAFVALLSKSKIVWYFFIIFNTFQGVFIGLSFLCTKRTIMLIKENMRRRGHNRHSSSATNGKTQSTSC